jgi:acetyl-CoA carboxylase biotin carboxylase subunit
VIALMANKDRAREVAIAAGVPVVPGGAAPAESKQLKAFAREITYPIMLKAVLGGSGRGMRLAEHEEELLERFAEAKKEALAAFGNDEMLLEKCIIGPRHIEVQVFADMHGNVTHVGERDCSVQRRNQKLVEEAPAAGLHPRLRERLYQAAVALCREVGYVGAGTIEYLVQGGSGGEDPFYFLEMNTRIQVEHPVTECVYGIDLLVEQFRVAAGAPLSFSAKDLREHGHAIEFRIYAEDTAADFKPCTGTINYLSRPGGPGVREDAWVEAGTKVSAFYDSLLSKLIVHGRNREEAITRARAVLDAFVIEGVPTTLGFHRWLLRQQDFIDARADITWLKRNYHGEQGAGTSVGPFVLPPLRSRLPQEAPEKESPPPKKGPTKKSPRKKPVKQTRTETKHAKKN